MATEAQKRAKRRYLEKCKQINIVIYPTESDIMALMDDLPDKTGYIKRLIRDDIARNSIARDDIAVVDNYGVYYDRTEDLTTGEVVRMASKILGALGETGHVPSIEESQHIVASAMSAADAIIGDK